MNTVRFKGKAVAPTKLVCVGRNYVQHAKELGNQVPDNSNPANMVVFLKPNSAIASVPIIDVDQSVHYEAELCFLVWDKAIVGVGIGLDLTLRELQSELKRAGLPWERAKAFDGSAILSDFVPLEQRQLGALSLSLTINDVEVQRGQVQDMLFQPTVILREALSFTSLEDGDVIMSGTPAGVGALTVGDHCRLRALVDGEPVVERVFEVMARR